MRKQLSKIIAASLTCAMLLPGTVFASVSAGAPTLSGNDPDNTVSGDTTISGDAIVNTENYHIILPTDLNFAIDKFQIAGKEQIYGPDYPIINASTFPVRVDLSVVSTGVSGQLVSENDAKLFDEAKTKAFYLTSVVPEKVNVASVSAGAVSAGSISSNSTSNNSVFPVGKTADAAAKFAFALDSMDDPDTDDLSVSNCATFTFGGKVNPYAKWEDEDLSVETAFKFIGISKDAYADTEPDAKNNLINLEGFTAATYTARIGSNLTANVKTDITSPTTVKLEIMFSGAWTAIPATYANGVLTVPTTGYQAGSYAMRLTLDSKVYDGASMVLTA